MYFDFGDYRPDAPRVPRSVSWLERATISIVGHLMIVLVIVFMPSLFAGAVDQPITPVVPVEREPVRFVHIEPPVDRVARPRPNVDHSDLDRRSATRVRPPDAENAAPASRGNTPEKVVGAPDEKMAGPVAPQPAPPTPDPAPPDTAAKVVPDVLTPPARPAAGSLGESLRNLTKYLQEQNLQNPKGGLTDQDPDIQFDSKGVEFGPWLRRFVSQVKHNWFVPDVAAFLKGRVVIQFNVQKNGTITDLRVVSPCPIEGFNAAALNALKMSNPTLPLPAEYPADKAFFTVTFHYNEG
jgi:TonB family protein